MYLKKGADPPGATRSVPLGAWGKVGGSSRSSGKGICAVGCVASRVRPGLVACVGVGERDGETGGQRAGEWYK